MFGTIRPESFARIELFEDNDYRVLSAGEIPELVASVNIESDRAFEFTSIIAGPDEGNVQLRIKPGGDSSWLLDGKPLSLRSTI